MNWELMIAISNPVSAEKEAEFNDWYENFHVPEILQMPGVRRATRYRVVAQTLPETDPPVYRYVAIYEVDNAAEAAKTTAKHMTRFTMTDSFDFSTALGFALEAISMRDDTAATKVEL